MRFLVLKKVAWNAWQIARALSSKVSTLRSLSSDTKDWQCSCRLIRWKKDGGQVLIRLLLIHRKYYCNDHFSFQVINGRKNAPLLLRNIIKHSIETSSQCYYHSLRVNSAPNHSHIFLIWKFPFSLSGTAFFKIILLFYAHSLDSHWKIFYRFSSKNVFLLVYASVVTTFFQQLRYWTPHSTSCKLCHLKFYCFRP